MLPDTYRAARNALAERLAAPLPGFAAQRRFEPELSFGRHAGPPRASTTPAAVVVLLYPQAGRWHLPLTLRSDTMLTHARELSLPGGHIDPGETSAVAVLRELREELGVDPRSVELIGQLSALHLFSTGFLLQPWVALVADRPDFQPDPREVAALLEVPLDEVRDRRHDGRHVRARWGVSFEAPHVELAGHRLWGATAMILAEFVALVDSVSLSD